jgi:hypothetical protein
VGTVARSVGMRTVCWPDGYGVDPQTFEHRGRFDKFSNLAFLEKAHDQFDVPGFEDFHSLCGRVLWFVCQQDQPSHDHVLSSQLFNLQMLSDTVVCGLALLHR